MRYLLLLLFLFPLGLFAQKDLRLQVVDKNTGEGIPFVNTVTTLSNHGSASDFAGNLRIVHWVDGDSLKFSCVGYELKTLRISQDLPKIIALNPKMYSLNAVFIQADNTYLYRLISKLAKNRGHKAATAKGYFNLQSFQDGERIELIEQYSNTHVRGYELERMDYKNGRLGLGNFQDRVWVSSESSKALLFHKTFDDHRYFPLSPLECSFWKMKKEFNLQLLSRQEEQNAVIYHIAFEGKDSSASHFRGEIWLDSTNAHLRSISFKIENSKYHPFLPIGNGSISRVDLSLNKSFDLHEGHNLPKQIDFDYTVSYLTDTETRKIETKAAYFVYDYQSTFYPPLFTFSEGLHSDYRKVNATPYNSYFWENHQEFRILGEKDLKFLNQNKSASVDSVFGMANTFQGFESPYIQWREGGRLVFLYNRKQENTSKTKVNYVNYYDRDKEYAIKAQIYLDVNKIGDSLHLKSAAVFDPYESFFNPAVNDFTNQIFNLCFDEVEYERRLLMEEIKGLKDYKSIAEAHKKATENVERRISMRLFEVKLGENPKALRAWTKDMAARLLNTEG